MIVRALRLTEAVAQAASLALLALLLQPAPVTAQATDPALARTERAFQAARYWDDRLRLLRSLGADTTPDGIPGSAALDSLRRTDVDFVRLLAARDRHRLANGDSAARARLEQAAEDFADRLSAGRERAPVAPDTLTALTDSVLAGYGRASSTIIFDGDTLNRLSVLGRLAATPDAEQRRRLFLALEPLWQSVNGDDTPASPYRTMLRLRRAAWGDSASPIEQKGPAFGLSGATVEAWLDRALRQWHASLPDTLLEPWDWYYFTGAASRRLTPRLPAIADIRRVNDAYYASLGAPPARLRVHYDLAARPGKYPVAFTDFGSRNRWIGDRLVPGEPWVFTSYLTGGFDNLAELLHESGHAIHIAAIRTRPAELDWPDNDTFTEALADLPALDLYEPAWQLRFLGDSAPLAESLRAKYASIVMDMAWALFEIRVHRDADADPNRIWASITSTYLNIRPHPEWA